GLAPPATKLSKIGELVEEQMSDLEERYKNILIDEYVIMPDHIHMILLIKNTGGASPSPTMNDVICAFKSLTSRICKQRFGIENLFQRSFYDHVIRNQKDYETRKKYILENPIKWYYYQVYEDE
ncbi:MAG: transposase, partial [Clostridia bacterium]|nr:transposase [Clostridia bacterium]